MNVVSTDFCAGGQKNVDEQSLHPIQDPTFLAMMPKKCSKGKGAEDRSL